MAQSPVIIPSSSPPPFRLPSETPPQPARPTESSSPGLPSPSSFFPKSAAGLQEKAKASKDVTGNSKGFQSAASLPKSNYFQDHAALDKTSTSARPNKAKIVSRARDRPGVSDSVGKVATGLGEARALSAKTPRGVAARSPLQSFVHRRPSRERQSGPSSARGSFSLAASGTEQDKQRSRTPSISLSVYSFDGGIQEDAHELPFVREVAKPPLQGLDNDTNAPDDCASAQQYKAGVRLDSIETIKQPRKRSAKTSEATAAPAKKAHAKRAPKSKSGGDAPSRQSRKPLAKSASFVLNSDDLASTQFAGLDATQVQGRRPPELDKSKTEKLPTEKPKRAPRKPKKAVQPSGDPGPGLDKRTDSMTGSESTYFAKPPIAADDSAMELGVPVADPILSEERADQPAQAHRRRRSWTPVKDTLPQPRGGETSSVLTNVEGREGPATSLNAILGDLAYSRKDLPVPQRTASGESLLKRRKIELADEATVAPRARKDSEVVKDAPAEKTKKGKVPKKKAQTITELATKAYRPEDIPQAAQATVSSFFAATGHGDAGLAVTITADTAKPPAVSSKKPRKPRSKKLEDGAPPVDQPKKTVNSKAKVKVRFNEDDLYGELYSPEKARLGENRQNFLFGTSSQLGTEDSPTFVRQMQRALQESEIAATEGDVGSPSRRSFIRVPTAPHGTSLSCGQAMRDLWRSAARNFEDDLLPAEARSARIREASGSEIVAGVRLATSLEADLEPTGHNNPTLLQTTDSVDGSETSERQHDLVDLCCTSPIDPLGTAHGVDERSKHKPGLSATCTDTNEPSAFVDQAPGSDDWKVLGSSPESPRPKQGLTTEAPILRFPPQLKRAATSPFRDRTALQALDVNTSPRRALLHTGLASTTRDPVHKKPRGRPRKDTGKDEGVQRSPKRGLDTATRVTPGQAKQTKTFSASQPICSSDFVNIDEISDPDAPTTPSPPRRRATSSPPTVRPLDLKAVASPSVIARAKSKGLEPKDTDSAATVWSKLKPEDASWTNVMPELFPQITATIKSTAPSTDLAHSTWYEKILLYDPIVLEDLTAWLNDRGVRVESRRLKPKPRLKGRKKKQDQHALNKDDTTPTEDEYELVREPLKPWMVQKWCEDKSVCCLWKEGLRGGVRTRY
ncbi:Structure-specific endonuclease subunit SLX4 [Cercospora beticola]|uniref:Structure-specific endonuclease subunit SLX4 n=1 Tax=Cercospora beticola TaxID=122368 RepID=A0A2G5HAP4_CERBT|nr:Structure-specific endonuclease subunit SLX4 [Cercospora beticola]PIA89610.1 Structure-specific endonuclease subunit SLX4 [Cercospora beticola]WPB03455.1 hypothetical protein RHO25_008094 [Cercospora beticola]